MQGINFDRFSWSALKSQFKGYPILNLGFLDATGNVVLRLFREWEPCSDLRPSVTEDWVQKEREICVGREGDHRSKPAAGDVVLVMLVMAAAIVLSENARKF